jgi:hypothetical protein
MLAALLMVLLIGAALAQPHPADRLSFDHWAYDYAQVLVEALDGALPRAFWPDGNFRGDPPLTRYEFAIGILWAVKLMQESDITAEEASTPRSLHLNASGPLGESGTLRDVWRELALEFLPEIIIAGEPVAYMSAGPDPPWPSPVPDEPQPTNLAIRDLRDVPHDHWLYPETQRVLWAAAGMKYTDVLEPDYVTPADDVPVGHWAYESAMRLCPAVVPEVSLLPADRPSRRYEMAMLASRSLSALAVIEQPTVDDRDLAAIWALLALEFWPEFNAIEDQLPTLFGGGQITPDHWLHPIVTRLLAIVEGND